MTRIHCAIQDWHQLPPGHDWLTAAEQARLEAFRFEKRQRDWLLGRWAAKLALLDAAGLSKDDVGRVEIASAQDGAPLPLVDGEQHLLRLSLSHSDGRAFAAAGTVALGCDLELVEPRGVEFVETWFTGDERERVERADPEVRDALVTMIWSAKESALKTLRTGLRIDTRRVEVIDDGQRPDSGWHSARLSAQGYGQLSCLWRLDGRFVLTIVTRDPVEAPIWIAGSGSAWVPQSPAMQTAPVYRSTRSS